MDLSRGEFKQVNWTQGVPGGAWPWMEPLGAAMQEIKLEAGAHMVQLDQGDLLHFYAAATPVCALCGCSTLIRPSVFSQGWVPNGNYTAGYIILDKDDPTKIIQRESGQFMIPRFDYETLCHGDPNCSFKGERKNVIFLSSATKIGPNRFRLFFGGGDGNVGTGVVEVSEA